MARPTKKASALWGCFEKIAYTTVWTNLAITKALINIEANHVEGPVVNQANVTIYHIRIFSKSFKCALRTRSTSGSLVLTFDPFNSFVSSMFANVWNRYKNYIFCFRIRYKYR